MDANSTGTNLYQENQRKIWTDPWENTNNQKCLQIKAFVVQAKGAPDALAEFPGSQPRGTTTIIKEGTERNAWLSAESSDFFLHTGMKQVLKAHIIFPFHQAGVFSQRCLSRDNTRVWMAAETTAVMIGSKAARVFPASELN